MPQLIPLAIAGWAALGGYITVTAFWLTVASVAVGQWQAYRAREAARDRYNKSLRDRLVSVATTTGMRSRVYGRTRNVDGVLYKATHGANLEFYTFVVALAGHEVDEIETVYFNDVPLTINASTGGVETAPYARGDPLPYYQSITVSGGVGSVTLAHHPIPATIGAAMPTGGVGADATYVLVVVTSVVGNVVNFTCSQDGTTDMNYNTDEIIPLAHVFKFNGAPGQDLSGNLISLGVPGITAGVHRFAGIACLIVRLKYDLEAYSTGIPQFSAVMRGAKCFDRRTGLTVWTENPAVIADDWAQHSQGGAVTASEVNNDLLIASANASDVTHAFNYTSTGGDVPGTATLPMYTCGIVCRTDADPADVLSSIVESMAGQWGWAAGQLRIKAGYYSAPVTTLDETWIAEGPRQFSASIPQNELVNVYNAEIAASGFNYTVVPITPVRATAYITADGRELPRTIVLEGISDQVHAQHVCGVLLRQSRQGFTCELPCNYRGVQLELFDTIAVNLDRYGLSAKVMDVVQWGFTQEGGARIVLKETAASIFDPDAGFTLLDASPNTNLALPWVVPQPTGVVVVSGTTLLADRSIVTRTRVSWDPIPAAAVQQSGKVEIQFMDMAVGQWQLAEENGDATETILSGLPANHAFMFRVRGRTTLGVRGPWSAYVQTVIAPTYYDDALDATKDITLVVRGNCSVAGNTVTKIGGVSAWDSDAYSKEFAYGACVASIIVGTLGESNFMFGLNSDPTTDQSYTTLDYAIHCTSGGGFGCYENGVLVSTAFTLAGGDALAIIYDGSIVRYLHNGTVVREVVAPPGVVFFFDSSFLAPGATMRSIRFSPLSANDWASIGGVDVTTDQIHPDAATEVFVDFHDFAGASFTFTTPTVVHSFTVTPPHTCVIEVTGYIVADKVLADSGNNCEWNVNGVVLPGAICLPINLDKRMYNFVTSYAATAGVALTFAIVVRRVSGNPAIVLGESLLRVTQVKR